MLAVYKLACNAFCVSKKTKFPLVIVGCSGAGKGTALKYILE